MIANPNIAATQVVKPADGELLLWACDQRDPRTLGPGLLNDATNLRFTDGVPETRKGVVKPWWANYINAGNQLVSLGAGFGAGTFSDPNGLEWQLDATAGGVWATRPGNPKRQLPLPTGVGIWDVCNFVQAFDQVFLFRGRYVAPLLMSSIDAGFVDLIQQWSSVAVYKATITATGQAADEIAYGPYISASSLTRVAAVATVVTAVAHGYVTGADITIMGASPTAYNGRWNITVLDDYTFTFAITTQPTSPATGTVKCSNNAFYWQALGSQVTLSSLTQSTGTATATTAAAHGFTTGQWVTIAGSTTNGWNGTYQITGVPLSTTFTFAVVSSLTSPAVGTITANTSIVFAGQSPDTNPAAWQRTYDVLPNGLAALFINDLLLVATAYQPATVDNYANISGGTYDKVDYLVATNYQDYIHFSFAEAFRINSGASDEIVDLYKFGPDVVVLKGKSWALLSNLTTNISQITSDVKSTTYGCVARGAWAAAGGNSYFLSTAGIIVIRQTDYGQLLGVDVPLSTPIPKTWKLIDWSQAASFRMAHWDNKLYTSVAFLDGSYGILVYDLIASVRLGNSVWESGVMVQGWTPVDTGAAMAVQEFYKMNLRGRERLLFMDRAGCFNLLEEATTGDEVLDATNANGVSWQEIPTYALSRAYNPSLQGQVRPVEECYSLMTWRPCYSVSVVFPDVNNSTSVVTNVTRSSTAYDRPFDAQPWDTTNRNDDFLTRYRQDYSVILTTWATEQLPAADLNHNYIYLVTTQGAVLSGIMFFDSVHYTGQVLVQLYYPAAPSVIVATTTIPLTDGDPFAYTLPTTGSHAGALAKITVSCNDPNAAATVVTQEGMYLGSGVPTLLFQESLDTRRLSGRQSKSFQLAFNNSQGRIKLVGQRITSVPGRNRRGVQL